MPKVSVIIPTFNQEDYLEDALKSLLGDFADFEVVVINDGSTNYGATEKIQSVIEKFPELQIKFINQENQGVCAARNNAIKDAEGLYIMPLDADDVITNSYLKEAAEILDSDKETGIVYCRAEFFGEKSGEFKLDNPTIPNMLTQNRIFNSAMYRKSDWVKVGGYKPIMKQGCEDWEFWITLLETGLKPYKIDKIFFKYRKILDARTSRAVKFLNYIKIRKKIIESHKTLYKRYFWKIIIPFMFFVIKNTLFNIVSLFKTLFLQFKKFLRRIYFKTAINCFNLYPNIKRINKKEQLKKINDFINNKKHDTREVFDGVIVSLTSVPDRMYDINYTIYSLLTQSLKPEKVILYLGKEKFPNGEKDIPDNVLQFKDFGLEIHFVEDIRSFTKLVPALNEFPNKTIVTADDDIFYEEDWLKFLVETHKKYPKDIIVHKHLNMKFVSTSENSYSVLPYKKWTDKAEQQASYSNFPLGVGGILYPVNSLYKDVTERKLFLNLCPHNDDVWFWAMAVLNGTKIRIADSPISHLTLVNVERELNLNSESTLYKENRIGRTDREFKKVTNYYNCDIVRKIKNE